MKQTKWQRLATIGLCSSLVINAFSGVTAVAETITIESSPTVASSAKEATSASSATPASTESSQETTETSREEVTQETEKPEVVEKISDDKEKTVISDYLNKGAKTIPEINKISPKATYNFPKVNYQFGFVDEAGNLMNPAPFSILFDYARGDRTTVPVKWTVISANEKATDSADNLKNMVVPAVSLAQPAGGAIYSVPSNFRLTIPKYYSSISIYNSDGKINPKYPVPIVKQYDSGVINNWIDEFHALNLTKDEAGYYKMYDTSVDGHGYPLLMQRYVTPPGKISHNVYTYFSGPVYYHLINRKVTENFVDDNGTKITPPTGFTQGKQTVIDSDPYTFKQSGTLPETYKASNGKTYKFKGWYKGKTKPNTLTATKAPSYAVTYDDNDDLNVVYEEIEAFDFPALTYQFGFVGEDGKLANPADINITYDYKTSAYRGTGGGADDTVSFGTIATNQSATTVGNLKNVTMPATSIARPTETGYNGDAYANFSIKLPRYYQSLNLYDKTGKINPSYPLPAYTRKYSVRYDDQILPEASVIAFLRLTQKPDQSYAPYESYSVVDPSVKYPEFLQRVIYSTDMVSGYANYTTFSSPVYYHLTNRKVTENFVDANGTKITPPTGFTQGKQTVINSDPYTFKQSGTLPDTYTTGGKTYKFKGWYKGKTKPNTLTTTKAPSYAVTYDDNDDLNVVYEEETVTTLYPSMNVNFVDEKGVGFTPTLTFGGKYRVRRTSDLLDIDLYDVTSKSKGNGQYTISANYGMMPLSPELLKIYGNNIAVNGRNQLHFRFNQFSITNQLKYVDSIALDTTKTTYKVTRYDYTPNASTIFDVNQPPIIEDANVGGLDKFTSTNGYFVQDASTLLYMDISSYMNSIRMFGFNTTNTINSMAVYTVTRKQVTENFVNTSGAKITPPTGFTQGNQIPMTSNTFKYTSARALPASYTTGGKTYIFQGWYKGKTKPSTLTTSTTPTYNTTFDSNDDMTAVYKEANISANLTMRGAVDVIDNGATMEYWEVLLKNTGEAPLTSVKIKPTTDWATGISTPTELFILGTGQNTKVRPITKEQWEAGFEIPLDSSLPVGGQLTINLLGTKVTGQPNQVLKAAVEVTGNFNKLTASDTVRIKDLDQETKEPTGEGFISVPTFNFGQVGVAGSTQQHGLKKAADYYGNGTRNPYLRIKKTQPNWSLTAQLSQPKSATDSLPTTTRLLLGTAAAASFTDYNQPTETKTPLGKRLAP
ncbi:WxL domain-containing protein [Enterococcus faecalis]|uniref:WxL domain-containing protein n=1 Tax=Enterococcus faecalis TaxID=1351 RepID=UPI0027DD2CF3|nr:WxL domain-containing protein [Enterococcus faecalis]MDQ4510853.1 WxL domain-containing protein [Enterococcus faecalis]